MVFEQTSFANQALGMPGQALGWGKSLARTYVNDTGFARKVVDVTITAANSTAYAFTVDGISVTYTSDASATTQEIRDGLIANARDNILLEPVASFQPVAAAVVRVTIKTAGVDTAVAESDANLALTVVQAATAQQPIGFGLAVVKRTGSDSTDRSCMLPSATGQALLGIAERAPQLTNPVSPDDKIAPLSAMSVGHHGTYFVRVETAVAPEEDAYFRHTASGANTTLGAWRNDDDGGNADQAVGCKFKTSAPAGGIAELYIHLS